MKKALKLAIKVAAKKGAQEIVAKTAGASYIIGDAV